MDYTANIAKSGFSIYDPVEIGDVELWIPSVELERILNDCLVGISVKDMPLRTRSKYIKAQVCKCLGYPIPDSFRKTQPRFLGQNFDTYAQKSYNLQVWNEELSPNRRYVILRISDDDVISKIKVVDGATLATLDTTGKLTQKYQARVLPENIGAELLVEEDTNNLKPLVVSGDFYPSQFDHSPLLFPTSEHLLPIKEIYCRLCSLKGTSFEDTGSDQERNRGYELHKHVCQKLGYTMHQDDGRFPDITNQLLEVKLQTSATIDLGLVTPNSVEALDLPKIQGKQIHHSDVRYAIFYARIEHGNVTLTHVYLTTGEKFFQYFPRFEGKIINKKIQIPLPRDFFE
jgi:hypothetical protein